MFILSKFKRNVLRNEKFTHERKTLYKCNVAYFMRKKRIFRLLWINCEGVPATHACLSTIKQNQGQKSTFVNKFVKAKMCFISSIWSSVAPRKWEYVTNQRRHADKVTICIKNKWSFSYLQSLEEVQYRRVGCQVVGEMPPSFTPLKKQVYSYLKSRCWVDLYSQPHYKCRASSWDWVCAFLHGCNVNGRLWQSALV